MKKEKTCMSKFKMLVLVLSVLCGLAASVDAAVTTFTPGGKGLKSLDHYKYYVWNVNLGSIDPQTITGASITLNGIYDWKGGNENDVLNINLLEWKGGPNNKEIIEGRDSRGTKSQFTLNSIASLTVPDDIGIGKPNHPKTIINFSDELLDTLKSYAVDGRIALGFDPDCHFSFYSPLGCPTGVEFAVSTTPVVPVPGAMGLAGIGIAFVGWLRMRKQ